MLAPSRDSPLHPVIEQLERAAGFAPDDPPATRLDKLEALLGHRRNSLDEAVPLITAMRGVPIEDAHWLDPTTQELLGLTIERMQRLPVLAIIPSGQTSRRLAAQPHVSALALTLLGRREGAALVQRVVGNKVLPGEVA